MQGQYSQTAPTVSTNRVCTSCAAGSYQDSTSHTSTSCKACSSTTYQNLAGQSGQQGMIEIEYSSRALRTHLHPPVLLTVFGQHARAAAQATIAHQPALKLSVRLGTAVQATAHAKSAALVLIKMSLVKPVARPGESDALVDSTNTNQSCSCVLYILPRLR